MLWPILIIVTLASILVGSIGLALDVPKLSVVLPAQVGLAFGAAYVATVAFTGVADDASVIWTCLAAALAIPVVWLVMAAIVGPPLKRNRSVRSVDDRN